MTTNQTVKETSGLAIASLVIPLVLGPFGSIPGIICGHAARRACRTYPHLEGDGLALAGLIVNYLLLVLFVLILMISIFCILALATIA